MKGIVLAGGTGSRLWPATLPVSKQLLPVYDKPLIYYPISTLIQAGINEVLLIVRSDEKSLFEKVLGHGENFGINIAYAIQNQPNGIAEAFIIAEDFINSDSCILILGDNIFHIPDLENLINIKEFHTGSVIFSYEVVNPYDFGVLNFDENGKLLGVMEKPQDFVSNLAVTGLYIFDNKVVEYAKKLKPSKRGELEISELINEYARLEDLKIINLGRGYAWLDTGNANSLHDASTFVRILEERTGTKIACLEEQSLQKGFLTLIELQQNIAKYPDSSYRKYLEKLLK